MILEKTSLVSGKHSARDIPCTEEDFVRYLKGTERPDSILPNLSEADWNFILLGVTPEEWE